MEHNHRERTRDCFASVAACDVFFPHSLLVMCVWLIVLSFAIDSTAFNSLPPHHARRRSNDHSEKRSYNCMLRPVNACASAAAVTYRGIHTDHQRVWWMMGANLTIMTYAGSANGADEPPFAPSIERRRYAEKQLFSSLNAKPTVNCNDLLPHIR